MLSWKQQSGRAKRFDKAEPGSKTTRRFDQDGLITYHRSPTRAEVKFGEGAIHYKDFEPEQCTKANGELKCWLVCPYDGLRYYR